MDVLQKPSRSAEEKTHASLQGTFHDRAGHREGSACEGFLIHIILLIRQKFLHCSVGSYFLSLHTKSGKTLFSLLALPSAFII